ncbi:MAG: methylglyoxal synthase [Bacillota bacterium]|nr:methylglyoxal synthase [Bacillota bacterium]
MPTVKMEKQKRIALIAHDNKKQDLIDWVRVNKEILYTHFLCGTGTTARLISEKCNLPVKAFKSGPMGGDVKIGSKIADGDIDIMIFFWDPLTVQPHDPDVKALLRLAVMYDITVAMNRATADFVINSGFMSHEYCRKITGYKSPVKFGEVL